MRIPSKEIVANVKNGALALLFAFIVWASVAARLGREREVRIRLYLEHPADVVASFKHAQTDPDGALSVVATLRGPRELIDALEDGLDSRIPITSQDIDSPEDIRRSTEDLIRLPDGITLLSVRPEQIVYSASALEERSVPVSLRNVRVTAAQDFEVSERLLAPTRVRVRGPRNERFPDEVETEPESLSGVTSDQEIELDIQVPPRFTCSDHPRLRVRVRPVTVTGRQTFEAEVRFLVPLDFPFGQKAIAHSGNQTTVEVVISGPQADLDRLQQQARQTRLVAFVRIPRAAQLEDGTQQAPVDVILPLGYERLRCDPVQTNIHVRPLP